MESKAVIQEVRKSLEGLWTRCGDAMTCDAIVYPDDVYGLMQRDELRHIRKSLQDVAQRVDYLLNECP